MPIVEVPAQLTVEHLVSAVKQLSETELTQFIEQLTELSDAVDESGLTARHTAKGNTAEDTALLASIEENARLPEKKQKRYVQLRRKCEAETLTEAELTEYQSLIQQLEARNVKRIQALSTLAQQRGTTLRGIMAELGLQGKNNAV